MKTATTSKEAGEFYCQYDERAGAEGAIEKRGMLGELVSVYMAQRRK